MKKYFLFLSLLFIPTMAMANRGNDMDSIYSLIYIFLFVTGLGLISLVVVFIAKKLEDNKNKKIQLYLDAERKKEMAKKEKEIELDKKYGRCVKSIKWWFDESTNLVRVYEESKTLLIKDEAYSFDDIIGVSYIDEVQQHNTIATTRTDNANMAGRAIVGGLIAGGLGAAVGSLTAKKQTNYDNQEIHSYVVLINTRNLSNPLIKIKIGGDILQTNEIVATINTIIALNQ